MMASLRSTCLALALLAVLAGSVTASQPPLRLSLARDAPAAAAPGPVSVWRALRRGAAALFGRPQGPLRSEGSIPLLNYLDAQVRPRARAWRMHAGAAGAAAGGACARALGASRA